MRIPILLISFLATCASVYAQTAGNKNYINVELTEPGTLSQALGDRANTIDSLVVEGTINEADFYTMWRAATFGRLSAINLEKANAEDNCVPANAFSYPNEQGDNIMKLRNIILGEGIEEIGANAFAYSMRLKELTLPSTLRTLGDGCFRECYNLCGSPLVLPEGLEEIGNSCFTSCTELSEVVLPSTIKSIGNSAFSNTRLSKINFPEGLEEIGDGAFYGSGLSEVILPESCLTLKGSEQFAYNYSLRQLRLPDGLTAVPANIASGCPRLSEVNIPSKAVTIGSEAFYGCPLSGTLTLPEGLTDIGDNAFYGCTGLKEVSFPSSLKTLGRESCAEWSGVKRMYCHGEIPAKCQITGNGTGPFGQPDTSVNGGILPNIPVYIPVGSLESYRKAKGWNIFFNYIELENFTAIQTVEDNGNATVTRHGGNIIINAKAGEDYSVYSLDGSIIASGKVNDTDVSIAVSPGCYIVKVAGNAVKIKM